MYYEMRCQACGHIQATREFENLDALSCNSCGRSGMKTWFGPQMPKACTVTSSVHPTKPTCCDKYRGVFNNCQKCGKSLVVSGKIL